MKLVKKQPKNWLIFSGLAFQIGIVMYIMVYLGRWIQEKWDVSSKWPLLVLFDQVDVHGPLLAQHHQVSMVYLLKLRVLQP